MIKRNTFKSKNIYNIKELATRAATWGVCELGSYKFYMVKFICQNLLKISGYMFSCHSNRFLFLSKSMANMASTLPLKYIYDCVFFLKNKVTASRKTVYVIMKNH